MDQENNNAPSTEFSTDGAVQQEMPSNSNEVQSQSSHASTTKIADRANIIIYSVVLVLIFIALGCAIFLFTLVKSQGSPAVTGNTASPTPTNVSTTVPAAATGKPASSQQAINQLNTLQSVVDNNASNENTDYSALGNNLSSTSQGSSEQTSINTL